MKHEDIRKRGFKERTSLEEATVALQEITEPHGRVLTKNVPEAAGFVTAAPVTADRDVPHYTRAAMDGWAVNAADTIGASDRSPNILQADSTVSTGNAVPVNTGEELPAGADAVVMKEHVTRTDESLEVYTTVAVGANVGKPGEDVAAGTELLPAGHRLRASDIGLLKSTGCTDVTVVEPPTVAVYPTGNELVQTDPEPGEIIETNGLVVSTLSERWGAAPRYSSVIPDTHEALAAIFEDPDDADIIVTTGGSSVGDRDLVPALVAEYGEILVHGVALRPGHPIAIGVIEETPVIMLPGYPVACIVNAMQFLRRAIGWVLDTTPYPIPETHATLTGKIRSEPGQRTFARVSLDRTSSPPTATPTRASGAGILSSVTEADGWVVIPEPVEGYASGESVAVEHWEWPW